MAKKQIPDQQDALSIYFDAMLTTSTAKKKSVPSQEVTVEAPTTNPIVEPEPVIEPQIPNPVERPETLRLLLCEIDNVKLALPVSMLNNIVQWPQQGLQQQVDQPDWKLGLLHQTTQISQIADIRSLLPIKARSAPLQANYILLVDEQRWGIACHHIQHVITCQSDAINWSENLTQQPWFTGIVNDGMYQIIDIPALLTALERD